MGLDVQEHVRRVEVNFSEDEIKEYERVFQRVNKSKTGCVSSLDLRNMLKEMGEEVSEKQLHDVIAEVDTNRNSCVELDEFLQVRKNGRLCSILEKDKSLSQCLTPPRYYDGLASNPGWSRNAPSHSYAAETGISCCRVNHLAQRRVHLLTQCSKLCEE